MNCKISPDFIEELSNNDVNVAEGLFFAFAVTHKEHGLLAHAYKTFINKDNEKFLRINLCTRNTDSADIELKVPLYSNSIDTQLFDTFIERLIKEYKFITAGHPNNRKPYPVLIKNNEAKQAFFNLVSEINRTGKFDIDRLLKVTNEYYKTTDYCPNIIKYFNNNAYVQYNSYIEGNKYNSLL